MYGRVHWYIVVHNIIIVIVRRGRRLSWCATRVQFVILPHLQVDITVLWEIVIVVYHWWNTLHGIDGLTVLRVILFYKILHTSLVNLFMCSGARIIPTKIRENFEQIKQNVQIIHTSKSMEPIGKHIIVRLTIVQIIRDVRIIKDQIIRTILYSSIHLKENEMYRCSIHSINSRITFL